MKKKCVECGEFFYGWVDKKFCLAYCCSSYNNWLNCDFNNFMCNINNILCKNCCIMVDLNFNGKVYVYCDKLLEQGFKFVYFINEYVIKVGKVYCFCYDQGYIEKDNGFFILVVRQEYVEQIYQIFSFFVKDKCLDFSIFFFGLIFLMCMVL